jgi:hypothetical protein
MNETTGLIVENILLFGIYYLNPDPNLIRIDPKLWPIDKDLDILIMNITSGWRKQSTGNRTAT